MNARWFLGRKNQGPVNVAVKEWFTRINKALTNVHCEEATCRPVRTSARDGPTMYAASIYQMVKMPKLNSASLTTNS